VLLILIGVSGGSHIGEQCRPSINLEKSCMGEIVGEATRIIDAHLGLRPI
jgi:hypothetical protein